MKTLRLFFLIFLPLFFVSNFAATQSAGEMPGMPKNFFCKSLNSGSYAIFELYFLLNSNTSRYFYQYVDANLNVSIIQFDRQGNLVTSDSGNGVGDCSTYSSIHQLNEDGRTFGSYVPAFE